LRHAVGKQAIANADKEITSSRDNDNDSEISDTAFHNGIG
jgi:hypothetical protein